MAEFSVEFNVERPVMTSDWAIYRHFIDDLRNRLGVRFSHTQGQRFSHNLPVLPPQENPPTRWFDVILQTNHRSIILRIRRDNLYLHGYRMQNSALWLELGSDRAVPHSPRLINGSCFLGFDGSYNSLESVARQTMSTIPLCLQSLSNAVDTLARSEVPQERARSLIIVIQMICESTRFVRISDYLATTFRSDEAMPPPWMLDLEHSWGDFSAALQRADAFANFTFRIVQPNSMQIQSLAEVADTVGILLFVNCSVRRSKRAADYNDEQCYLGRPLVEVFSVTVKHVDKDNLNKFCGKITVTDGLGAQNIFNRISEDYESVQRSDKVFLNGPAQAISAYGSFTINVKLEYYDMLSPDERVINGKFSWNVFNTINEYDKPLSENINGDYGSVVVSYIVLKNAVEATVEVLIKDGDEENSDNIYTLINNDEEVAENVYGLVTVGSSNYMNKSVLFQKKAIRTSGTSGDEESESVQIEKPAEVYIVSAVRRIQLSRSVVAVPLGSNLIVKANLCDHDLGHSNNEIANGTADFLVRLSGISEKKIGGKFGKVTVKVTWASNF